MTGELDDHEVESGAGGRRKPRHTLLKRCLPGIKAAREPHLAGCL